MVEWNRDVEAKVIAKAWKDEGFRKKLMTNPREALKEFGVAVPKNVDLKTLVEDQSHFYFVLPPAPANQDKLSNAELEKLAAGTAVGPTGWKGCPIIGPTGWQGCPES